MLNVSLSNHSGYVECEFAKECSFVSDRAGECEFVHIISDERDKLKAAKSMGLKPEEVPAVWYFGTGGDPDVLRMEFCAPARANPRIEEGLRALWPQLFVDDEQELLGLQEAAAVAQGVIDDPDAVTTELGIKMLDKVTSDDDWVWTSGYKLTIVNGVIEAVPVYSSEDE